MKFFQIAQHLINTIANVSFGNALRRCSWEVGLRPFSPAKILTYLLNVVLVFLLVFCFYNNPLIAQKNNILSDSIAIVRDKWGVPHIFGKTDADAAYGLAWAHAEDNFRDIQLALLPSKKMLGRVKGVEGAIFDYALQFLSVDTLVDKRYETDLSPEFKKVIEGYTQGINDYAKAHPKEILIKKAFPFSPKDIIKGYVLNTSLMAGVGIALKACKENRIKEFYGVNEKMIHDKEIGSNAFAVAPQRMEDGKGYLLANSHQPIEGIEAWYEAHISSEEGWNMLGALFPGGITIFVGSNPNLGWAHTNNYHYFGDIYQLEINPKNKKQYKYDGVWKDFHLRKAKLVVKIAGLPIKVSRKLYDTEYGPVFKTKQGMYAFRFPGYTDIRSAEQWYKMNKSSNLEEFQTALKMQAIPLFNVVYNDKEGNVLLHSGGRVALRNPNLDWTYPITANTSDYKWTDIVPYNNIPTILNPSCGYVYNANNTPLHATAEAENWKGDFVGLQRFEYNRGQQLGKLFHNWEGKFTEQVLHDFKYDASYASDSNSIYLNRFQKLRHLDEQKYPQIADAIKKIKEWDLKGNIENPHAALAMVTHDFLRQKTKSPFGFLMIRKELIEETDAVWALTKAKKLLNRTHGSMDIPLGQVQRLIRGKVSFPADGLREVLRATDSKLHNKAKGIYVKTGGDCYIQIARFSEKGAEVRTVNALGASTHPDSPHYTDQMELFTKHQYKEMSFDKTLIFKEAERVYYVRPIRY